MELNRKEFKILKYTSGIGLPIKKLNLSIQQLFTARWMNLSDKRRCFLKHAPGSGKTLSSLYTAKQNYELYKLLGKGRIIIVGFQKKVFMDEILRNPELGFITVNEYETLKNYEKNIINTHTEEIYKKYLNFLKKKIQSDGYILFFGYQELYNNLFCF